MKTLIPFTAKPIPISPTQEKLFNAINGKRNQAQQFCQINPTEAQSSLNIAKTQIDSHNLTPILFSGNKSSVLNNFISIIGLFVI